MHYNSCHERFLMHFGDDYSLLKKVTKNIKYHNNFDIKQSYSYTYKRENTKE